MKKILLTAAVAVIASSLYAFDKDSSLNIVGTVGEYTKTEYSISQKFGDFYRVMKAKYVHSFTAGGKEAESIELTSRDSVVDKISLSYNASGNIASKVCTDAEGKVQWEVTYAYDGAGNKIDESEFNAGGVLTIRSIIKNTPKQSDESFYNTDGVLCGKTITKFDDSGKISEIFQYNAEGTLDVKQAYTYNETGKLSEVQYTDCDENQIKRVVYRFDAGSAVTEKQTYNAVNKLAIREIYKYDSTGNVSKITTYAVAEKFGTTVNELIAISEYSYKYGAGNARLNTVSDVVRTTGTAVDTAAESVSASIDAK